MIGPTTSFGSGRRVRCPATTQRSQPRRELLVGERLDEIVVGAGVEAADPVAHRVACGEHQDRHVRAGRAHPAGDLEPGDVGQADVQDDRLDAGGGGRDLDAGDAVGRQLDHVPVLLEEAAKQSTETGIVLDDEQVHGRQPTSRSTG